jgi:DNA-binding transcriptional ArsR family regulator
MNFDPRVSEVAAIISDNSRSTMLLTLLDGRKYTASELARVSKITPQTDSFHLSKMIAQGVIRTEKYGRHKYISIANVEIAKIVESLLCLTPPRKPNSLREVSTSKEIYFARSCYDHLAGTLGVEITNSFLKKHFIIDNGEIFELTSLGEDFLKNIGVNIEVVRKKRRSFSHRCLDWSERKFHLAGALGNSILIFTLENGWVERMPLSRALRVTKKGKEGFRDVFGVFID